MDELKIGDTVRIVVGCESGNCVGQVEAIDEHGVDVKVTTHGDPAGQASSVRVSSVAQPRLSVRSQRGRRNRAPQALGGRGHASRSIPPRWVLLRLGQPLGDARRHRPLKFRALPARS